MVGESNQIVFLIQIDASSFAEFDISEFEISRVGCMLVIYIIVQFSEVLLYNVYCVTDTA